MKRRARQTVRKYFNTHCFLSPVFHDFTPDQKRVQEELNDNRILLRWNHLIGQAQVWYDAPSGLYCVFNIEGQYSPAKAIRILKEKQKTGRQMLKVYQDMKEREKREEEYKIAQTVEPTADALGSWSKGKVTTSGKGLGV